MTSAPERLDAKLRLANLSVNFGKFSALDAVDLEVLRGQIVGVIGLSGSGKSTLLRAIAGLQSTSTGVIQCDGQDITEVPASQRRFGFMHQELALFEDYTVRENIEAGLRFTRQNDADHLSRLIDGLGLSSVLDRFPSTLSGGQRQRVALARSLAPKPHVLLLDEPLSHLDSAIRTRARDVMMSVFKETGVTALMVSHDIVDCRELCDSIAILARKRIVESGTPRKIIDNPEFLETVVLTGVANVLPVNSIEDCEQEDWKFRGDVGCNSKLTGRLRTRETTSSEHVYWVARPDALSLHNESGMQAIGECSILNQFESKIGQTVVVRVDGTSITLRVQHTQGDVDSGKQPIVYCSPSNCFFYGSSEALPAEVLR